MNLQNFFSAKTPPYPPCQISDLAGNPGAPSLGEEGEGIKEKLPL